MITTKNVFVNRYSYWKLVVLLLLSKTTFSQTTLAPGDMAFLSLKVSGGDGFSVVTFKDLCPNTVIYFTDNPYRNTGGFCTSMEEFCIRLTVTTLVPAGSQITYTDGAPGSFTFSAGAGSISFIFTSEAGSNNGFSSSGDNCFAFQGTYAIPVFICSIKTSAYTASGGVTCSDRAHTELPSSLTLSTNALFVSVGSNDGIYYNCSSTSGTHAALRAAINNSSNWTAGSSTLTRPCTFSVTDAVAASCTVSCTCNIWSEDFNTTRYPSRATTGANSNTANAANDWTTSPLDCDDGTPYGTVGQSYWGTLSGSFNCQDVEGGTSCSCSTGGTTLNEWLTENIDISGFTNVSICVSFSHSGTMEPATSTSACNNADDIIQGQYRINGGAWTTWFYDDDETNLSPATVTGLSGTTIQMRIYLGNKANDEIHTFDNVCVTGTPIVLPVDFLTFTAEPVQEGVKLNWATVGEQNISNYEIERSANGWEFEKIGEQEPTGFSGYSSYSFIDYSPFKGINYYRIVTVEGDGEKTTGTTKSVYFNETQLNIEYFNDKIVFSFENTHQKTMQVFTTSGQLVTSSTFEGSRLELSKSNLPKGVYISLITGSGINERIKLVIQ